MIWFEGSEQKERTLVLENHIHEGPVKEIRVIDSGTISNRDFKIMTNISGPIVACTRDNSLAQAISYGKIPCYEARFRVKYEGFLRKIEDVLGDDSALYRYCSGLEGYQDILLRRDLSRVEVDGLAEEAKQFGEYIRNEANLKPILNGVVNEKLLRQQDPDFAEKQDRLVERYLLNQYLTNSLSQDEFKAEFKALLREKGLL